MQVGFSTGSVYVEIHLRMMTTWYMWPHLEILHMVSVGGRDIVEALERSSQRLSCRLYLQQASQQTDRLSPSNAKPRFVNRRRHRSKYGLKHGCQYQLYVNPRCCPSPRPESNLSINTIKYLIILYIILYSNVNIENPIPRFHFLFSNSCSHVDFTWAHLKLRNNKYIGIL